MKKINVFKFVAVPLYVMVTACGGGAARNKKEDTSANIQNVETHDADIKHAAVASTSTEGALLIAKSDCMSCHKEREKSVGPSYADVAKKYGLADTDKLTNKVINGGSGSYGNIPMSPHPSLSENDAKAMIKYILTLK